ncbi:hypothetical protein IWQ62_000937 [Dispira parvispora]|uniref:CBS domain-containing protein n=1 Tax=Dispira parvispora TaxID=1520584 RepID=A0A9W8ATF9_9FUNG|nr:hypothetical protein IWQ62_000937 [Dispira parvispora]
MVTSYTQNTESLPLQEEVSAFLKDRTVDNIVAYVAQTASEHNPVVDISHTTPIGHVLHILDEYDLQSLPVYRAASKGGKDYAGIVTLLDLLGVLVKGPTETLPTPLSPTSSRQAPGTGSTVSTYPPNGEGDSDEQEELDETHAIQRWKTALSLPVSSVASHTPPLRMFNTMTPLGDLLRYLAQRDHYQALVHTRINPTEAGGESSLNPAVVVITQADLVRYLWQHHVEFPSLMDQKLPQLVDIRESRRPNHGVSSSTSIHSDQAVPVQTVPMSTSALRAFHRMWRHHVSSLAITDKYQTTDEASTMTYEPISAEISVGHLRGITEARLDLLKRPVMAFLYAIQEEVATPFVVRSRFTFRQCIAGLLQTGSRRAWYVADVDDRPLAVLSFTDILGYFTTY